MKKPQTLEEEIRIKWHDKHIQSGLLADSYRRIGFAERAERVEYCGTEISFIGDKLHSANLCRDRLCPMCGWRRSKKIFGQVSQIMDEMGDKYAYIFVTYTIRNCSANKLNKTVNTLLEALYKLHRKSAIKRAFKGSFRALEITHDPNLPETLSYHPHIHMIYAVNPSYFKNADYISREKLADLWSECLKIDYYPQVYMQRIKGDREKDTIRMKKAVAEVAKYTVKGADYLRGSEEDIDEAVIALITALSSRRLCAFSGCFKETAKKLKLDDLDDGDLIHTDQQEQIRSDVAQIIKTYRWQIGYGYYLAEEREATNDDLRTGKGICRNLHEA